MGTTSSNGGFSIGYTENERLESEKYVFEKENHLPKLHLLGFKMLICRCVDDQWPHWNKVFLWREVWQYDPFLRNFWSLHVFWMWNFCSLVDCWWVLQIITWAGKWFGNSWEGNDQDGGRIGIVIDFLELTAFGRTEFTVYPLSNSASFRRIWQKEWKLCSDRCKQNWRLEIVIIMGWLDWTSTWSVVLSNPRCLENGHTENIYRNERRQAQLRVVLVSYGLMDKLQLSSWYDKIWYEVFKYSTKCLCSKNMCHPNGSNKSLFASLKSGSGGGEGTSVSGARSGDGNLGWWIQRWLPTKTQSCLKVLVFYLVATQLFFIFTPKIPGEDISNLTSIFFRWVETTN